MKIQVTDVFERRKVTAAIEGAEPRLQPYSRQGRRYVPDAIVVEFTRYNGGAWRPGTPQLLGSVLKVDGSLGKNRADEVLWSTTALPEWVDEFVVANTPLGDGGAA